jgi:hypothetical protein
MKSGNGPDIDGLFHRPRWVVAAGLVLLLGVLSACSATGRGQPVPPLSADDATTDAMTAVSPAMLLPTATPSDSLGFGMDYCGDDLAACAELGASWSRHTGVTTVAQAKRALDEAESLEMRLILRMNQGDWGWNGREFDLSILETMRPLFDHPALLGFYGLHEPLERFSLAELRLFYRQYRQIVEDPTLLLWHDIMGIPDSFTDDICDLCGVATNPHINDPTTGQPINDWTRTDSRLITAQRNLEGTTRSALCVLVQVYGGDGRHILRMPTPDEYRENVRRIVVDHGVRCLANYAYHHNAYEQTLGDPDQAALQTAVRETGQRYFGQ